MRDLLAYQLAHGGSIWSDGQSLRISARDRGDQIAFPCMPDVAEMVSDIACVQANMIMVTTDSGPTIIISWTTDPDGNAWLYAHTADTSYVLLPFFITAAERRDLARWAG